MAGLYWFALASLFIGCQGMEFTLSLNTPDVSNSRAGCGVLLCIERHTATNATVAQSDGDLSASASQQSATISTLKVFKMETETYSSDAPNKRRRLIASLTSQQSRLTRVSDGISIDGRLQAGWATLRLELAKQKDCDAEYTCEAVAVSGQGSKLLSTSQILRQPRHRHEQDSHSSWTPQTAMQVLALVQRLGTMLGNVGSSLERLEKNVGNLKDSLDHDVESLKSDLNTKTDRLEDKILSVGKELITQSDRLEDKIEFVKTDSSRNNNRFEDKLEHFGNHLENCIRTLESTVKEKIDCEEGETTLSALSDKISTVKTDIVHLEANIQTSLVDGFMKIEQQLDTWDQKEELLLNTQTLIPQNITCTDKLSGVISQSFMDLDKSLKSRFDDISATINVSAKETQTLVNTSTLSDNLTFKKELTSALTEALTPKSCHKGMGAIFSSTPYTVINPGQDNPLDFPVLCDTVTDGGGWIVIQRRTRGDVNFYRGWEDYKNGFGSMDRDFWLGNEKIHSLTNSGTFELRIDLRYKGDSAFAHYEAFSIDDEKNNYALHVGIYDGTAGDSLITHNGQAFSTHDKDNDKYNSNCAVKYTGAWWYERCHSSNLNGKWNEGANKGPRWSSLSSDNPVSYSEMKIRRFISVLN